jgi:hypothetical protein
VFIRGAKDNNKFIFIKVIYLNIDITIGIAWRAKQPDLALYARKTDFQRIRQTFVTETNRVR